MAIKLWYKFDQSIQDHSRNSNDMAVVQGSVSYTSDEMRNYIVLDNETILKSTLNNINYNEFNISFGIKNNGNTIPCKIISNINGSDKNSWRIVFDNTNGIRFECINPSSTNQTTFLSDWVALGDDEFAHFSINYLKNSPDFSKIEIYKNGQLITTNVSDTYSLDVNNSDNVFIVGEHNMRAFYLSDIRLHDEILDIQGVQEAYMGVDNNGLIAHYTFDNTIMSCVGNQNKLVTTSPNNIFTDGVINNCLGLDYTRQYKSEKEFFKFGSEELSCSMWVMRDDKELQSQGNTFFSIGLNDFLRIRIDNITDELKNKIRIITKSSETSSSFNSNRHIDKNTIHHVCVTIGENTIKLYIDGVLDVQKSYYGTYKHVLKTHDQSNRNLYISGYSDTAQSEYFSGALDDIRIYDRELSDSEVMDIYNIGRIYSTPNVKRKLADCDFNNTIVDSTKNVVLTMFRSEYDNHGKRGYCFRTQEGGLYCNNKIFANSNVDSVSYSLWFKSDINDSKKRILIALAGTSFMYSYIQSGKIFIGAYSNQDHLLEVTTVETGKWYNLAVSYVNNNLKVYLNNELVLTDDTIPYLARKTNDYYEMSLLFVGHEGYDHFNGTIDSFKLYNYDISPEEVDSLYKEFDIDTDSEMIAWYPLNGDTLDYSGSELHGQAETMHFESGKYGVAIAGSGRPNKSRMVSGVKRNHLNKQEGTLCLWFYNDRITENRNSYRTIVNTINPDSDKNDRTVFDIMVVKDGDLVIKNGNINILAENVLGVNTWNHIAVSYENKSVYLYINGLLFNKYDCELDAAHNLDAQDRFIELDAITVDIMSTRYRYNDLRIYRKRLIAQEIRDIYNGKIVSYSFDDPEIQCRKNMAEHDKIFRTSDVLLTYVGNENGYSKYAIDGQWTRGNYPYLFGSERIATFRQNIPVSCSMDIYTNVPHKFKNTSDLFKLLIVNDTNIGGDRISTIKGTISKIENVIHSKDMENTIYVMSCPLDDMIFNPETDFIYVREITAYESETCLPFTERENPVLESIAWDNSGYNNHGLTEIETTPIFVDEYHMPDLENSQKGETGVKFAKPNSCITINNPFLNQNNNEQEWTINTWLYLPDTVETVGLLDGFNDGIMLRNEDGKICININDEDSYYVESTDNLPTNDWCMVSFVFRNNDGLIKIFINGKDNTNYSSIANSYNPKGISEKIFLRFNCNVKPIVTKFDMFATALPDDEIYNQYTQALTVSTEYKMYGNKLIETSKLNYINNGIFRYNLIPNGFCEFEDTSYYGDKVSYIRYDGPGHYGINKSIKSNYKDIDIDFPMIELYEGCSYDFSMSFKLSENIEELTYAGLKCFDKYGYLMPSRVTCGQYDASEHRLNKGLKRVLTRDAKKGDMELYLNTAERLEEQDTPIRHIGICDFEDAPNYERFGTLIEYGDVDLVENKITLLEPVPRDLPAGTKVGKAVSAASHFYFFAAAGSTEWSDYSREFSYEETRYSTRYVIPFLWLPLGKPNKEVRHSIACLKLINKTFNQVTTMNYRLDMTSGASMQIDELREGLQEGRNSIVIKNVNLPTSHDFLSSIKNMITMENFFDILGFNEDGTANIRIPVWCRRINGDLFMRVYHHNNHDGTLLFDNLEQSKFNEIDDIFGHRYSILNLLENFRDTDGKFHFLIRYPNEDGEKRNETVYNEWKQTTNPISSGIIEGYEPINIDFPTSGPDTPFKGLGLSGNTTRCLLDANGIEDYWFFVIGCIDTPYDGVPASREYGHVQNSTELWVKVNYNISKLIHMNMHYNGTLIVNEFREDETSNITGQETNNTIIIDK